MNEMHCYTYSIIRTVSEVARNYLKYKKRPKSYFGGARRVWCSQDKQGWFPWFKQVQIVCSAPATEICLCCSLTFLWHCAECCLKRRECSQMIIIYPVSLRSSFECCWKTSSLKTKTVKTAPSELSLKLWQPNGLHGSRCMLSESMRIPWGQCHPLNTCSATRENTMCSPLCHSHLHRGERFYRL